MTTLQSHRQKCSESSATIRRAHILILLLPLFIAQIGYAQDIKGIVTGINHEPLFGASVSIERTTTRTTTDTAGNFSIHAKKGGVLRVSFIGYTIPQAQIDLSVDGHGIKHLVQNPGY